MDIKYLKDLPPWEWPEGTASRLLEFLKNRHADHSDRLLAAEMAGDLTVTNDDLANGLLDIVSASDEDEVLRSTSAIALGAVMEYTDTIDQDDAEDKVISDKTFERIERSLRKLFDDPTMPQEVRRRILEASVRAPREWHEKAVAMAYRSPDRLWRVTAVFCMGFVGGFEAQILEALTSDDEEILYEAVGAAGSREVEEAWIHVEPLVTSDETDKDLRLAAIEAIAAINPEDAIDILAELTDNDDEDIADAAEEALAMAEGLAQMEAWEEEGGLDDENW